MNKLPNKISNLIKAKNLGFKIPKFIFFDYDFLKNNLNETLNLINKNFKKEKKIILRSAAFDEDVRVSNAGKYDSILVNNNDDDEILSKLKLIFSKYKKKKRICNRSKIYRGLIFKRCNIR